MVLNVLHLGPAIVANPACAFRALTVLNFFLVPQVTFERLRARYLTGVLLRLTIRVRFAERLRLRERVRMRPRIKTIMYFGCQD